MKLKTPLIILLTVFTIIALKFVLFPASNADSSGDMGAAAKAKAHKVNIVSANVMLLRTQRLDNTITATGTLLANEEIILEPEISGKITKLYFKEGTYVSRGARLFNINDQDLRANLAKLNYNLNLARENAERQKKLLAINAVSQQDYDTAVNAVRSTEADIAFSRATINKTQVVAPFSGRIGLRYVSEGAIVGTNSKIATLQQLNPLKLDFSVPGQYASQVSKGDLVHFSVQGDTRVYVARISAIEPQIDLATRTLKLRAIFPNTGTKVLLPGAFVDVQLILHAYNNALMVPTQSLVPVLKGTTVYLYSSGHVKQVPVVTAIRTDVQVQVTQGLKPGDTVITTGLLALKPGDQVKIKKIQN